MGVESDKVGPVEEQIELKKVFGDVFFRANRDKANNIVKAHWFGVQSVETVKLGGYKMLEMMKQNPYSKLLNCNKNVIGSWDMALDWAQNEWAPQMREGGLRYLAQVVPSSYYATITIENLIQKIDDTFEIRTFEDEGSAVVWLLSLKN